MQCHAFSLMTPLSLFLLSFETALVINICINNAYDWFQAYVLTANNDKSDRISNSVRNLELQNFSYFVKLLGIQLGELNSKHYL